MNLFVNIYHDPDPAREAELRECEKRNRATQGLCVHAFDGRPAIQEMIAAANERTGPDEINILANSDIHFDGTLPLADGITHGECWALTRWDANCGSLPRIFCDDRGIPRIDSQDAWIWRGPCGVSAANFTAGVRGCDNALTYLFHRAGIRVSNPSLSVRAIHRHESGVRRYGHDPSDCIQKPYLLVTPHELGALPRLDMRL